MATVTLETIEVDSLANVHSHVREGEEVMGPLVKKVVEGGSDVGLFMPNTKDGLRTAQEAADYSSAAKCLVPPGEKFEVIPCMLLTEDTPLDEIRSAPDKGIWDVKILPRGRTTNSDWGVRHFGRMISLVRECGMLKIDVHIHPEHPWMTVPGRDAEYLFQPVHDMLLNETDAVIVSEHGTDGRCIPFWKNMAESGRFFVTLAPQHLGTNEDVAFGDVRSVCKPPIKTERDRLDFLSLIAENNEWLMAGPDDAPHPKERKHVSEGCCACGAYHAPFLLSLYAHILGDLLKTEEGIKAFVNFTSRNARKLHGLPDARRRKLVRASFKIPLSYQIGPWTVEPFWAGKTLDWSLVR